MSLVNKLAEIDEMLERQRQFEEKLSTYINSPKVKSIIKRAISNDIYINESILDTIPNKTIEFHVADSSQFSGLDSYEISIFESDELCNIKLKPNENNITDPTKNFDIVVLHMDEEKLSYDDVYTYIKNAVGVEDDSES